MDVKRKSNKLLKLIVLLLIAIILIFSHKEIQEKFINFISNTSNDKRKLQVVKSIHIDAAIDNIAYYDNNIITWSDKKLTIYDLNGSKIWEKEFNLTDPKTTIGENRIYVYDKALGDVYYLNSKGETLGRFQTGVEIVNIMEASNNIIVHTKEEGIRIMDLDGGIAATRLIEDNSILTYSLNNNSSIYSFSTLNLNGENIKSEIQTYNIGGEFLSTLYLDDQIVLYLRFTDRNRLIALTDKGLYCIDDGNILWEKELNLVKDIYIKDGNIGVLYGNTFELFSMDGSSKDKYTFSEEYKKMIPFGGYTVLYGSNHIIGLKGGEEVFEYESEDPINKVVQGNQNLIVVYGSRIDIIS